MVKKIKDIYEIHDWLLSQDHYLGGYGGLSEVHGDFKLKMDKRQRHFISLPDGNRTSKQSVREALEKTFGRTVEKQLFIGDSRDNWGKFWGYRIYYGRDLKAPAETDDEKYERLFFYVYRIVETIFNTITVNLGTVGIESGEGKEFYDFDLFIKFINDIYSDDWYKLFGAITHIMFPAYFMDISPRGKKVKFDEYITLNYTKDGDIQLVSYTTRDNSTKLISRRPFTMTFGVNEELDGVIFNVNDYITRCKLLFEDYVESIKY